MNLSFQFYELIFKLFAVVSLIHGTPLNVLENTRTEDGRDIMDIQLVFTTTSPTTSDDKEDFFRKLMQYMDKPREEEEDPPQDVIVIDHHHDVILHDSLDPVWQQCANCLGEDMNVASNLEPAYPCDGWDPNSKTCFLDRNVGDTVTFKLKIPYENKGRVTWRLEFHSLNKEGTREFLIPEDKPLWNIVIGSLGYEFRISPVTEMDVDSNAFSATLEEPSGYKNDKVYFKIRPVPIDLGFVYPGETLVLNMASFIALPQDSMRYSWFLESGGEARPLPSNMRESPSGGALTVDELRAEQGGVIVCAVHSNRGLQVARKRFLVGNMRANPALTLTIHNSFRRRSSDFQQPLQRNSRKIKVEEQLEKGLEDEEDSTSDPEEEGFEYEMPYEGKNVYDALKELPQTQIGDTSRKLPPPAFKAIENRKPGNNGSWTAQNPYHEEPPEKSGKFSSSAQEPSSYFKQPLLENKVGSSGVQEPPSSNKHTFSNQIPGNKDSWSAQGSSPGYKESSLNEKPSSSAQEPSSEYEELSENNKSHDKYSSNAQNTQPDNKEPSLNKKPKYQFLWTQEPSSDSKEPSLNKKPDNKYSWSPQEPSSGNGESSENKKSYDKNSSSAQKPSLYQKESSLNEKPSNNYLSSAQKPSSDSEEPSEVKSLIKPSNLFKNVFSQVAPSRNGIFDSSGQMSTEQNGSNKLSNTLYGGHESQMEKVVLITEDRLSKFIAECSTERQCSGQATCVRNEGSPGFCRCLSGYRGNGISCWESFNSRQWGI